MSKYQNLYRVESTRLKGWDYRTPAWYFVTICTVDHRCFLGRIHDGVVVRTAAGEIVAEEWARTEAIRSNVRLDEWIVMPNHVHGIVEILDDDSTPRTGIGVGVETPQRGVSTAMGRTKAPVGDPSRLAAGSLGAIIGQFKGACTKRIRSEGSLGFGWQTRFHDHIIRDPDSLEKIQRYIRHNPTKWPNDRLCRV